jgi:hypothetical protein
MANAIVSQDLGVDNVTNAWPGSSGTRKLNVEVLLNFWSRLPTLTVIYRV